jgi:bla regulator protein blaR1
MITPTSSASAARSAVTKHKQNARPSSEPQRPAAIAAGRAFGLSMVFALLVLGSAVLVITRLFQSWRVTPGTTSHDIIVLGQRLSYPAANTGAIVVAVLAALGMLTAAAAASAAARELLGDRRFRRALAARSPLPTGGAWLIDDDRPQAFCAGLFHPRVYFSTGTLEMLQAAELAAVLAHERHHASRRDPLRLACGRALAAGLFYIPALRRLVQRQHVLAEISADEAAVITNRGDRSALASAMLSFSQASDQRALGVDPERIDHLIGERPQWRFPVALCVGAAVAFSLFVAVALLAAHAAAGSATLAPPFLSSRPCIAVLAMIPAAAGVTGLAQARRRRMPARDSRRAR